MRFDGDEKCLRSRCWLELLCMLAPLRAVCESSAGVGCDAAGSLDSAGQSDSGNHRHTTGRCRMLVRGTVLSVFLCASTAKRPVAPPHALERLQKCEASRCKTRKLSVESILDISRLLFLV